MNSHYGIEAMTTFDPSAFLGPDYTTLVSGVPSGGNPLGYPSGTIPLDPKTGRPYTTAPPVTPGGPQTKTKTGSENKGNKTNKGNGSDPNSGKKQGFFDPRMTAIDTTNPHALPIIELIKQFLMQQAQRGGGQPQRAAGPMSQLYPNGAPARPTGQAPAPMSMRGGPVPPPPRPEGYPVNNFRPVMPPTGNGGGNGGGNGRMHNPRNFNPIPLDPVNAGSTQIRSFQPQYMNQHTANNFDPVALLRSL